MKKEKIYILISKDHKRYRREVNARTFERNGIKYGIVGDSTQGYSLTHLQTGMAITFSYKLKYLTKDIDKLITKFEKLPEEFIKSGIRLFNEAEIEK